jgi:hypothetical protein
LVLPPALTDATEVEPLEWQVEHAVPVEFTFLWAETLLGAVPIWQPPQLSVVGRAEMVPVVAVFVLLVLVLVLVFVVVVVVVVVVVAVWQVVQSVVAVTNVCEAGCAPTTQAPQLGIAFALPARITGNDNTDAKTAAFTIFIDFMLPPKS